MNLIVLKFGYYVYKYSVTYWHKQKVNISKKSSNEVNQ